MEKRLKILVLAGGLSEERDVSLASARAVTEAIKKLGHNVAVIDSASGISLLDAEGKYLLAEDTASLSKIALKQKDNLALSESIQSPDYKNSDIVFLALHGGRGEDGTIQALLELAGMKYTGSGVLASAVAMHKAFTKRLVSHEGILTPDWLLFKGNDFGDVESLLNRIQAHFAFPLIVKPNNSGSTVGLTLVRSFDQLAAAVETARKVTGQVLAEQYISGREITASVLNGRPFPLVEIIPTNELYDYQCKYTKGKSQYVCPAPIPDNIRDQIQETAARVYEIVGCSGLARVDFILDKGNKAYFLEVNTLPGMTELSLAPMAAREAGMDFEKLVDLICKTALNR
ncbi:MAG: D-alanine--D-alanine ligase [candidate division Zixibacteria bacterium HGW-Zixibacteria-1]|nr:MAG: D-alanine--D-alanine ligase [candidate division Zixibacteria bacterium HGW-Zixibacteria-1]